MWKPQLLQRNTLETIILHRWNYNVVLYFHCMMTCFIIQWVHDIVSLVSDCIGSTCRLAYMLITQFSTQKINFHRKINILKIWNRKYPQRSEIDLSDETIRIQNFYFNRNLWWKNFWNLPKLLRCWKAHSFQTIRDIDPNINSIN